MTERGPPPRQNVFVTAIYPIKEVIHDSFLCASFPMLFEYFALEPLRTKLQDDQELFPSHPFYTDHCISIGLGCFMQPIILFDFII